MAAASPKDTGPLVESDPTKASTDVEIDADGFIKQEVVDPVPHGRGPYLRGISDVGTQRVVTEADFKSVGINQKTLTFDWTKDFKIPVSEINPEAVEFLVKTEYGFSVVND